MYEMITSKKIIFPGSQIEYNNLLDVNEKYFVYCSTYSAFIYNKSNFELENIISNKSTNYISSISLNKSLNNIDILALYYNKDILIYNLLLNKLSYSFPFEELNAMQFNKDSKLLLLNNKGELFISKIEHNKLSYINKVNIDDNNVNCFKWYPFNINEFVYSTYKNKIYYFSLLKNNNENKYSFFDTIKKKFMSKCLQIKDEDNFSINILEFYDLDENNKYLLIGTTNSKIYLADINNYEITNTYNKYGKTPIKYLYWLNNQPGSFISINEKNGKYIKWNVSKTNYSSIGKLSDYNINTIIKYDNDSNFLISNENGDVFIFNEIENKINFIIKQSHTQSILDLRINPNNENLFITSSNDGNIRLFSIKDNYKLIHIFKMNKSINSINNKSVHVTSLKWSPKYINFFASGDSQLNLKIFDIETKKQIISYKCLINKGYNLNTNNNIIIQGIDWNIYDNILVGAIISIFLFSFVINNNNPKEKYSLILITEIKLNNYIYNPIFEFHNEYIIVPSEAGSIYFYSTTNDKLSRIIDISSSPSKEIKGHKKRINNISFNNSNQILSSASDDMKIGLYNLQKSKETPMSMITDNINKFLIGQESPIIQILFLVDDTLISGGKNGSICIWDIYKQQMKYKINENVGDIYSLNTFNKFPFLFIASGLNGSIRFFNLNYKLNLEKMLQIERTNLKEIEKYIKYYFYEEDWDALFDLLNEPKKEKKLVSKYLNKVEQIKKEYSKFNNNNPEIKNKIDFSLKEEDKNNIIDKLIKESAIIQEWELFCEFSILRNKWEDAICFAPKVSLDYWQELMNKYEKYINSEEYLNNNTLKENKDYNIQTNFDEKEVIAILNENNYKKILELCIKKKDFQNALMIWLMEKSRKKEDKIFDKNKQIIIKEKTYEKNSLMESKINNLYEDIKLNLEKEESIKKIIDKESLTYLKEGKRIKSIINYNYYENKNIILKTLSKSNFIELGFLLCNDTEKDFNDYFLIRLYEKYKNQINDNILCILINKIHNEDYKNIFYQLLLNKNNIKLNKEKSEIIKIIEKKDLSSLHKIINKYKTECFNKLLDYFLDKDNKLKINETEIIDISKQLCEYIKILILLKIKKLELNDDLKLDIVLSILIIECLNYNYKSIICLIIEYFITSNMFNERKSDNKKIYNFIFNYINYIQKEYKENSTIIKYKLNQNHLNKYKLISSAYVNKIINVDNFNKIRNIVQFNNIYKCNNEEMKYFYLENEIYPRKNNTNLSSFSNSPIKSDIIKLNSGNYASLDEYLEISKFIYINNI